jgi:hypothetical protein
MRLFIILFMFTLISCGKTQKISQNSSADISCEELCKSEKGILNIPDEGFSYLSFTNFGYMGVGRCRGHALLTQKFSLLASYDENDICSKSPKECMDDLKLGIKKIQNFETHTFKSVNNLLEFSSIPDVKMILYSIVRSTSHKYSGGRAYIKNTNHENERISTFHEIKRRLSLNNLPYVGVTGSLTGKHAVLIYKTQSDVLCARDSNVLLDTSEACENYFYIINSDVYYHRYGREPDLMSKFKLSKDEDKRISEYVRVLGPSCIRRNKELKNCK